MLAGLLAVLLIAGGVLGISLASSGTAEASILRAPVDTLGPNPFGAALAPSSSLKAPSLLPFLKPFIPAAKVPKPPTPTSPPTYPGDTPGLYGGTQKLTVCDAKAIVRFLAANPDKAAAWAAVQGITVDKIPLYISSLTDAILRTDTRVTNHGFINGKASTIPEVMQAGTAVLVDLFGVPRARCFCGNPLTPPTPTKSAPRFSGPSWSGFDPAAVTAISAVTTITKLVLVDVVTGTPFIRPVATSGDQDVLAPPDALAGSPFASTVPPSATPTTTTPGGGVPPASAVDGTYTVANTTKAGSGCGAPPNFSGQQVVATVSGSTVTFDIQGQSIPAPYDPATGTFSVAGAGNASLHGAFTNAAGGGVRLSLTLATSATCALTLDTTRTGDAPATTVAPTTTTTTAAPVPVTNITPQGTVAASSTFSGQFPASAAVDGDLSTSWFSIGAGDGPSSTFTWQAPTDMTIASIGIIGNEHNADPANRNGFGYQSTEIQVIDSSGNVTFDQTFPGPSNSARDISTSVNAVGHIVKLTLHQRESPDCGGFAELQIQGHA